MQCPYIGLDLCDGTQVIRHFAEFIFSCKEWILNSEYTVTFKIKEVINVSELGNSKYPPELEVSREFVNVKPSPSFDKYYLFNSYPMLLSNLGRCKQILSKISNMQLSHASNYSTKFKVTFDELLNSEEKLYVLLETMPNEQRELYLSSFKYLVGSNGIKISPYYLKFLRNLTKFCKNSVKGPILREYMNSLMDSLDTYSEKFSSVGNIRDKFFPPDYLHKSQFTISDKFSQIIVHLFNYLTWYNYSRILYSFKGITSLEALNIIREDSSFKPSDLYEMFDGDTPLAIQIINPDKTIRSVGLLQRDSIDSITIIIINSENESHLTVLSKDILLLSCKSFDSLFEKLIITHHSYSTVTSIQALNPWEAFDLEDYSRSPDILKEISIEELLYTENSVFNLVASMLALGYYLTFKPRINPDRERVNSPAEVNANTTSESDGTILHYDIAESTISIVAPKRDIIDFDAKGTPKKPHYRRGHSHRYWEGTGEDKKLVKHYVAGYGVNGYEPTEEDLKPKALIKNISALKSSNEDSTSFFN